MKIGYCPTASLSYTRLFVGPACADIACFLAGAGYKRSLQKSVLTRHAIVRLVQRVTTSSNGCPRWASLARIPWLLWSGSIWDRQTPLVYRRPWIFSPAAMLSIRLPLISIVSPAIAFPLTYTLVLRLWGPATRPMREESSSLISVSISSSRKCNMSLFLREKPFKSWVLLLQCPICFPPSATDISRRCSRQSLMTLNVQNNDFHRNSK